MASGMREVGRIGLCVWHSEGEGGWWFDTLDPLEAVRLWRAKAAENGDEDATAPLREIRLTPMTHWAFSQLIEA